MFRIGQTVIDTKTDEIATIQMCITEDCIKNLYIIQSDETDEYRIVDEDRIIPYDKYYWDDKK